MDVRTAAINVAADYKGGARALAKAIGKNETSFSHEINGTGSAKLGLHDAVKMTMVSGDMRVLNAFAAECGFMCVPLPDSLSVDGDLTMQALGDMTSKFGEVISEVSASCADDRVTENELTRVEGRLGKLFAAGQQVIARMRAKHEASKPAALRRAA